MSPWIEAPLNFGKPYWNKKNICHSVWNVRYLSEEFVHFQRWWRSITFNLLLFKESCQTRKPTKVAHINCTKLSLFRWYFCHFCGFHIVNTLCEEEFIFTSFNTALRHNPSLAKEFFQFRIFHNYWIEDRPWAALFCHHHQPPASLTFCHPIIAIRIIFALLWSWWCEHSEGGLTWLQHLTKDSDLEFNWNAFWNPATWRESLKSEQLL